MHYKAYSLNFTLFEKLKLLACLHILIKPLSLFSFRAEAASN